jgi:stage II sporulation protein D
MRLLAAILLVIAAALPATRTSASEPGWPVGGTVSFEPIGGTILEVAGRGQFRGGIEVASSRGSITVVDTTDIESYLMGLAEVPGSWPMDALKAQAVAARTYALWEKENGSWRRLGFDVCADTICQVFSGVAGERRDNGARWIDAVKQTRGEVLLYKGKPALTRYHASSGGQTLAGETVFPRQGRLPYLRPVRDPADRVSPLHVWDVTFTRAAMDAIARAALGVRGTIEQIEVGEDTRTVTVRSSGGAKTFPVSRFRAAVSDAAARLFPDQYPGPRLDGKAMPETIPSSRFTIASDEQQFVVHGKGWGHGVGMSQWGAKGRAERGDDYRDILSSYYSGLRISSWTGSRSLRVGIVQRSPAAAVTGSGPFAVRADEDYLARSTVGRWSMTPATGETMRVRPPDGFSLPLVLSGFHAPSELRLSIRAPLAGFDIEFVLPKAAEVTAKLERGSSRAASGHGVFEAGEGRLRLEIAHRDRLPARSRFEVTLEAYDGSSRASHHAAITIVRPSSGRADLVLAGALVLIAIAGGLVLRRRFRSRKPDAVPWIDDSVAMPVGRLGRDG